MQYFNSFFTGKNFKVTCQFVRLKRLFKLGSIQELQYHTPSNITTLVGNLVGTLILDHVTHHKSCDACSKMILNLQKREKEQNSQQNPTFVQSLQ